ncbi:MAG: hypothetical protein AMJ67_16940 [Betaproteobacteria bacterium SG8_41]|jgi:hypothetical protein|nr:MAG: hypothetical protein AMJ67_16940 [Betaproteobacteria bacterium SG8_41]KPK69633.1 MAG: hypothetical protein AMJ84_09135 [Acidithiobacillales bacterium SM23_46]
MKRYLIEIPHEAERIACYRAIHVFLASGSHFLTRCDWGCKDGIHKAWMTVEAESREAARRIIPPAFRNQARVVELQQFSMEEVETALSQHVA